MIPGESVQGFWNDLRDFTVGYHYTYQLVLELTDMYVDIERYTRLCKQYRWYK